MNRWLSNLVVMLGLFIASSAYGQSEQLRLNWQDNATNEDGTKIERATSSCAGPFTEIFSLVGANLVSYTDNNLQQATVYCYRVRAFNAGGFSAYSNTAQGTTPAILTVNKIGSGAGTIDSSPVGVSCGTTCTAKFAGLSSVTLTAIAAVGSLFDGWSGACSGTGPCTLTMNSAKSVTASFSPIAGPNAAPSNLTVTVVP